MKNSLKLGIILIISLISLIIAMGIGSVYISPVDTLNVLSYKIFNFNFLEVNNIFISILWNVRFPRVLLAFICGGGLAVSGVIMQSILNNPLSSSYTLGVSSGASLGASFSVLLKISIFGIFTNQIFGFIFGVFTAIFAIQVASKVDRTMQNNSIILSGMAFSFFANSVLSIMMTFFKEDLKTLIFWQMGSFATKNIAYLIILYTLVFISFVLIFLKYREMDIMTFGEQEALSSGIGIKNIKWFLLIICTVLTGAIVSVVGVIGFIDLFTPHIARKIFGAGHKYVLPASLLIGGFFMVLCDLIARTVVIPLELPVGAITSLVGAPFFIYLYFSKRE